MNGEGRDGLRHTGALNTESSVCPHFSPPIHSILVVDLFFGNVRGPKGLAQRRERREKLKRVEDKIRLVHTDF